MKSESFPHYLNKYLSIYLPGERGLSENSIMSYRDAFSLFLAFLKQEKGMQPEKLSMSFLNRELIIDFAGWLEVSRQCSVATRNLRIGAIRAFCKWLSYENPTFLQLSADVCSIRLKKEPKPAVNYLSSEAMKYLLAQPDSSTKEGLRDITLLALIYDSGARVSEIANLVFSDIRFAAPPVIRLTGKGNKSRIVPILPQTMGFLSAYIERWNLNPVENHSAYVFTNRSGNHYTRAGIKYILDKYVAKANSAENILPDNISPHTLRHSKAMHLLQSGVNVVYIRDILGHANLNTTERYAKADTAMKREALERAALNIKPKEFQLQPSNINHDMAEWLRNLTKT